MSSLRTMFQKGLRTLTPSLPVNFYLAACGIEYRFVWIEEAVPAGGKVYLKATIGPNKYLILNHRDLQMNQEFGQYTIYTSFDDGTLGAAIKILKERPDSDIESELTLNEMTNPTNIDPNSWVVKELMMGQAASSSGNKSQGGIRGNDDILIYTPGSSVLVEFWNCSAAAANFQSRIKWFEMSDKSFPQLREF